MSYKTKKTRGVEVFNDGIIATNVSTLDSINVNSNATYRNLVITNVGSFNNLYVSSAGTVRDLVITNIGSFNNLYVSSTGIIRNAVVTGTLSLATALNGANVWRGITTILSGQTTSVVSNAALAVKSGYPAFLQKMTDTASHIDISLTVASIVDGTSFTAQADKATIGSLVVAYMIVV